MQANPPAPQPQQTVSQPQTQAQPQQPQQAQQLPGNNENNSLFHFSKFTDNLSFHS